MAESVAISVLPGPLPGAPGSPEDPCEIYPGYKHKGGEGYGSRWYKGHSRQAHRVAWIEAYGPIPDEIRVCHRCDNPPCVKLSHLFLGTDGDNVRDAFAKGRRVQPPGRHVPGEGHVNAKLTTTQALDIRRRYQAGERPTDLGREFGVTLQLASQIGRGVAWKHLAEMENA